MASKKYYFLPGILCLLASYSFSQDTTSISASLDSNVIPDKRMPQHTEFLNGTYNFPAKPRNQWEIGVKVGAFTISSDVPAIFPTLGAGFHVRKGFGYVFSARLEYMYGRAKGLHYLPAQNFGMNQALRTIYNAPSIENNGGTAVFRATNPARGDFEKVYYNYQASVHDLAIEGLVTLNNIRFHKAKTGLNLYGLAGIGGSIYETMTNAMNGTTPYNYNQITIEPTWKNRKETRDALKDMLDDSYETVAENQGARRPKLFGKTFKPVGHVGGGVAYRINNRFNIALEDRFTITKDDLLDGQRWQENHLGSPSLTRDYDAYNFVSLGLNFNIGAKATEPLYWLNPLDYAYSEIRNPRLMRLPKPVLPDADGDGVTDQFDQEQTPQGCPVDTHGVSRDTDGDGVPDCRDKELVTPTYCQPVDADGVGKCPCPEGCGTGVDTTNVCLQKMGALPSVTFSGNAITLSSDARSLLSSVASRMRNNPECKVVVIGYCASSKSEQQRSWDRVNAVINYLVEKEGISGDRFIFQYGQEGGDCNTVDLRPAGSGEEGPTNVPAPHPQLRNQRPRR